MGAEYVGRGKADGTILGRASGNGAKIGFFGSTTVVQQTGAAAGTNATTTQALANALRTACNNLGLTTTVT